MIETTTSADGTTIAFERAGHGEPLLLLGDTRMPMTGLAGHLAPFFTVFTITRRAADSADAAREIEDVAAVLRVAGGEAHLFGHASGAALALTVAASGLPVVRVAVYEPTFVHPEVLSRITAPTLVIAGAGSEPAAGAGPHSTRYLLDAPLTDAALAAVLEEFFG